MVLLEQLLFVVIEDVLDENCEVEVAMYLVAV